MTLQEILESVKSGSVSVEEAERIIKKESYEEMGYAKGEAAGKATGRAEGEKIGEARGKTIGKSEVILKMHKKGYSLEQIMDVTEMSEAEIKAIIG